MQFANCAVLAAFCTAHCITAFSTAHCIKCKYLFSDGKLRLCSSADEAGIVLNLFLNFEQK